MNTPLLEIQVSKWLQEMEEIDMSIQTYIRGSFPIQQLDNILKAFSRINDLSKRVLEIVISTPKFISKFDKILQLNIDHAEYFENAIDTIAHKLELSNESDRLPRTPIVIECSIKSQSEYFDESYVDDPLPTVQQSPHNSQFRSSVFKQSIKTSLKNSMQHIHKFLNRIVY